MIRLALTDLDDTLIPFGSPCASEQSRAAIHATLDAGVRFGPVTGRLPVDMRWMFGDDEPCYATGAFANGQVVRVDGRTVKEVVIPASELSRVQEVLDEHGGGYLCLYDPWELGKSSYVTRKEERLVGNPPPTYGDITQILPRVTEFSTGYVADGEPAYVKANIQTTCPADERAALTEYLCGEVPELGVRLAEREGGGYRYRSAWVEQGRWRPYARRDPRPRHRRVRCVRRLGERPRHDERREAFRGGLQREQRRGAKRPLAHRVLPRRRRRRRAP